MMFEENVDFQFVDLDGVDFSLIKFLKGEFTNVLFAYGKANFEVVEDSGKLTFDYVIVEPGNHTVESLNSNEKFRIIVGDLLVQLITERQNEPFRNDYSEESDLQ